VKRGSYNFSALTWFMVKPTSVFATAFSEEQDHGMTHEKFSGSALACLSDTP
jgi:hypothetical protein